MTRPTIAVGYIRVSTEKQNEEDYALERQAAKIRRYCAERGMKLVGIYDDTCSAAGDFSVERRPGLSQALCLATEEDACLVVPEPTRLFRNVALADTWLQSMTVPVISVRDDRVLSRPELLDAVAAGQQFVQETGQGTVKALDQKRLAGVKLGSKADLTAANAASKRARARRSDNTVDAIAHVILEDCAYRDLSHRAFADLLNRRGILTGWSRPWTAAGVKRQRKEAEERILEWEGFEHDDAEGEPLPNPAPARSVAPSPVPSPEEEERAMEALPTFGLF